ncbi:radical SAM protein [Candidatus Woesearchaeota archaeon]|nr:radical SAM protein [Candidatus Woesearchaeota archaeon]
MAELSFNDLGFENCGDRVKVSFLKLYYFFISKDDLEKASNISVEGNKITFHSLSHDKAEKLFMKLLVRNFANLTNKVTENPTFYIHKNSGIPLIGSLSFGIVDKGTMFLEVKPFSGCNADCIFCSVDEGPSSKKILDIVVEKDYLVDEVCKLLDYKKKPAHIYINPQGEPLLYPEIISLVKGLSGLKYAEKVIIITNGTLLTRKLGDELNSAGVSSLNISLHSLDPERAKQLFNMKGYNVGRIKEVLEYLKGKVEIILAPVLLKGMNEKDVEEIVAYGKTHGFSVNIQNFLHNNKGRNPVKEIDFDSFYSFLRKLEDKYSSKLILQGGIPITKELPKPFRKGDIIEVEMASKGRYKNEFICFAKGRIITVYGEIGKNRTKIKITRDNHNVFYGVPA